MRSSSIFAVILSPAISMLQTFALPLQDPRGLPSGYSRSNLTWIGNITENGPEMSFNGSSFKDIEAQILQVNPEFSWNDHQDTANSTTLSTRALDHLSCDPNNIWWAQAFRIQEGIDYLRGKTGTCYMEAGPRVCARISCSYKSAIWWCNDNDYPIQEDCSVWSDYAQDILDNCQTNDASSRVRGQEFSIKDWNIMVGFDDDHC
ncbi:hypothetical protein F4776DRAFT_675034 [Hypoxylon sp. NC0597]|nr:hypothetical protein F4776DRAFT_675034 [Hypoxylon sp. NC0597]